METSTSTSPKARLILNQEWSDDHYTSDAIPDSVVDEFNDLDTDDYTD